jgi:4a-hydroxytetrahydrobiopterin dehydratase
MSPRDAMLEGDDLAVALATVPDWTVIDGRLHREFVFDGFMAAMAFMNRVAPIAERLDHHPDWSNSWNRVVVDIVSHDSGGLTDRCIALAQGIDGVAVEPT